MAWLDALAEEEPPEPEEPLGTVVTGNLAPDMHVGAKELVRKALKKAGFKTVDLGGGVSPEDFVSKTKEVNADVIAVSINLYMAKDNLPDLSSALEAGGLKDKVIFMIGGSAVKQEDADEIGALYGKSKQEAVDLLLKAIEERK
jgi:5-methyltetrahydrofolate--homocysteine methyltransferase